MERQKGERCGIDNCRSRFYHLADGQWTCSNGHVQEGRLDIREDEEYQPRKGDRLVIERDDSQVAEEKVFTGKKGLSLFLQAFQFILRKQIAWLINEQKFPKEFQLIVRDLWTLRLESIYSERSSRAPSSSGYTSAAESSGTAGSQAYLSDPETASQRSTTPLSRPHSRTTTRSRSTSRGRNAFSKPKETIPKLLDTISILYIAALLLHLPLEIITVHRWILEQDLVYFRAIKWLPVDMVEKMEVKWKRKFEPKVMPTAEGVRKGVFLGVRYYFERFGVVVPRIAAERLVGGWVLGFGCPPEIYPAIFILADMIQSSLIYPAAAKNYRLLNCPDIQLMALLVISLKLCWGLDDDDPGVSKYMKTDKKGRVLPRFASKEWEIANMGVDWEEWKNIFEMEERKKEKKEKERNWQLKVEEAEIYGWSGEEMDEYLGWFEKNWAGEVEGKPTAGVIRLFEEGDEGTNLQEQGEGEEGAQNEEEEDDDDDDDDDERNTPLHQKLRAFIKTQSNIKFGKVIPPGRKRGRILRPGEKYMRYKKWEDVKSVKLRSLYLAAAGRVGLEIEGFVYVVQKLEHRLGQFSKGKEPKREVSDEEGGDDYEEDNDVGGDLLGELRGVFEGGEEESEDEDLELLLE
ncbi:Pol I core factor CF [Arthrobotrys conoides]|uniref:Pol I core factor CF n=1 Tax=Arthrobotrys conoides TaxID=74498 RepID=A0AAN8NBP0_9PEZI